MRKKQKTVFARRLRELAQALDEVVAAIELGLHVALFYEDYDQDSGYPSAAYLSAEATANKSFADALFLDM